MGTFSEGFERGVKIGGTRRRFGQGVFDAFDEEQKLQREVGGTKLKKQAEMDVEKQALEGLPSGFVPESYKLGSTTFKNPAYVQSLNQSRTGAFLQRRAAIGAGAESGRLQLAKESINNIRDIRNILFPEGTPDSFRRGVAAESNIFGGFSQPAQDVFRKAGASVAGRQLIQTGVAARPEEVEALRRQFIANFKSNPSSAFNALKELEDFYGGYLGIADPSGLFHQQGKSGFQKTGNAEADYDSYVESLINQGMDENEALEQADQEFGL